MGLLHHAPMVQYVEKYSSEKLFEENDTTFLMLQENESQDWLEVALIAIQRFQKAVNLLENWKLESFRNSRCFCCMPTNIPTVSRRAACSPISGSKFLSRSLILANNNTYAVARL